jgi:hypothetical protein
VIRYRAFVLNRATGRYATDGDASRPLLRDEERPYRAPLPEGVGERHDELPFPPAATADDYEGQLTL